MARVDPVAGVTAALALKVTAPPDIGSIYDSDGEQRRLIVLLAEAYARMFIAVHQVVQAAFPQVTMRLDDPAARRMLAHAATRVVRIDETTRPAIAMQLQEGQQRGYSGWQIAHGVPDENYRGIDGLFKETWSGRAETVARTELQEAQRLSAIDRYIATGMVDRVQIIDGDQWDETCRKRDGKIVPIQQAPGLAHPNCTLVLVPVLREGAT